MGHQRNQRRNQKILKKTENENTTYQNLWDAGTAVQRGKFIPINKCLPQKTRKISCKQPNCTPQGTRNRITKPKVSRRKEITKIRV